MAFHAAAEGTHVVGLGNIRVIICHEDGFWFAQGIEIDYAADGRTLKEVKKNFEDGLKATIGHHLKYFDTIEKLLCPTPTEVWSEMVGKGKDMRFFQVTEHEVFNDLDLDALPYSGIDYYQREEEMVAA